MPRPSATHRQQQAASPESGANRRRRARIGASHSELISLQWHRERPDLELEKLLLAIYFMRLGALVDRPWDRRCQRKYGIRGGDMRILLALRRGGAPYVMRPTDLFRALLVTSGAVTKKVDRLVEAGYAERLPDPTHQGGFLIHLTRQGMQIVDDTIEHLSTDSVLEGALAKLSAAERKTYSALTLRILSELEKAAGDLDEATDDDT